MKTHKRRGNEGGPSSSGGALRIARAVLPTGVTLGLFRSSIFLSRVLN